MTYAILILGGFDNLFNVLFFSGGNIIYTLGYKASPDITRSLSAVPRRPHPHPTVLTKTLIATVQWRTSTMTAEYKSAVEMARR